MTIPKAALLSLLPFLPGSHAWGTLGHDTVAFIAQNFISSSTATWAKTLLNDSSPAYLANVATWADSYRYTSEGAFSAPFHYIDAADDPPTSCNVDYDRDCGAEGCVVSALANYTVRVKSASVSTAEKQKALKWIIHFVGDIHQPLHDEALDVGGNTINVTFAGTGTNLHHIWDSNMPEKLIGGYSLTDAKNWASNLTAEIKTGGYKSEAAGWLSGIDENKPDGKATSLLWAKDANAYVCSTVVPQGADAVRGKELEGAYYDKAIPVIEMQIAKAGYRLAAWLNVLAMGKVGLKVRKEEYDHGYGHGNGRRGAGTVVQAVRVESRDEERIMMARRARAAYGWNCGPEGHAH
ncbi:S1/P1 nuclease-domain-containing protein [Clohesyomyces aquaticus]|uniref:S1/P1 nuclease-domain-containing protein n=1 Tax=Clohesyomyces aquaticus TaxID=1231657 RepID=A0A1Y2A510_9PLEO|nr:S1/P1 nuclease-domain-containing protein [Clohesyomyces aquaticus]